jgi:hypothetical protein
MSESEKLPTRGAPVRRTREIPDVVDIGEFTLVIRGIDRAAGDDLSAEIRETISQKFARREPLLALAYCVEVEEFEVTAGSRRSRNRFRLKLKKGRGLWARVKAGLSTAVILVGVASTDYGKLKQNAEWVYDEVEHAYSQRGTEISIQNRTFYHPDSDTPFVGPTPPDYRAP